MSIGHIILIVVFGLVALLAIGGAVATQRRRRARSGHFDSVIHEANRRLAHARAEDRGWERDGLEAAARRLFAEAEPSAEVSAMTLVQVVDKPGVDEDKAVFRFTTAAGEKHLTLGRDGGGAWVAEGVS
jgi:hypothetical protein